MSEKNFEIRPTRDFVLVELKKKEQKAGEIYLTPTQKTEYEDSAVVKAIGPDVKSVVPGDQVLFEGRNGHRYDVGERCYLVIPERDIHGVVSGA